MRWRERERYCIYVYIEREGEEEKRLPRASSGRTRTGFSPPGLRHSPPRKPCHSATNEERGFYRVGQREFNPRPFTGLPAVAAVSYLGLRGAPLYRRTATLSSFSFSRLLSLSFARPPSASLSSHLSTTPAAPSVQLAIARDSEGNESQGFGQLYDDL